MQAKTELSEFSLLSRLFGNLFYRDSQDPVLASVFAWLQQGGLAQHWPLEKDKATEKALEALQMPIDLKALSQEYQRLFQEKVSMSIADYVDLNALQTFRAERGMPELENMDHFALLLLSASWIEDNLDSVMAQRLFFQEFLLPSSAKILVQIEQQATLPFYRELAYLTREILSAMADELEEA